MSLRVLLYITFMEKSIEIWKDILDYEGKYQISNMGRVKSLSRSIKTTNGNYRTSRDKFLKLEEDKDGYLIFTVYKENIPKKLKVSRIVGLYFVPNPDNKPHINHKKGIKKDNRHHQLEWVTIEENNMHAQLNSLVLKGENHPNSKLSNNRVLAIRRLFKNNKNINKNNLAKKLKVRYNVIYSITENLTYKHLL